MRVRACLHVRVYVSVCSCRCIHLCVCRNVEARDSIGYVFLSHILPFFSEIGFLIEPKANPFVYTDWPISSKDLSVSDPLLSRGVTGMAHVALTQVLENVN